MPNHPQETTKEKSVSLKTSGRHLTLIAVLLVAALIYGIFYLNLNRTKEKPPQKPVAKVQPTAGYLEAQLLAVKDGDLNLLATASGGTKVIKIHSNTLRFRLVVFKPKDFEIISDTEVDWTKLKVGDKLHIYLQKGVKGFPSNLGKIKKIEVYRESAQ